MKRQIASPLIAFSICILLLPLASLATIAVAMENPEVSPITSADGWGSSETFDNVPTGTVHSFNDFALSPNLNSEAVVLGGRLWVMFRDNDSALLAKYSPSVLQNRWNISFDAFTPRNGASYNIGNHIPWRYGLKAMIVGSDGRNITGIELLIGPSNVEGILSYDPVSGDWTREAAGILPAISNRSPDQESSPDRYTVSIEHSASRSIQLTVTHSRIGTIFVKTVSMIGDSDAVPSLHLYSDSTIAHINTTDIHGPYPISGGWMLDNFQTRAVVSRFAEVQPNIELNRRSDPQWLKVVDPFGMVIQDASVTIAGRQATFNPANGRYEAATWLPEVDWTAHTSYSATVDGVTLSGFIKVTTVSDPCDAFVTKWWNGWPWATVLGRDDCSGPQTVLDTFIGFDHPLTAYIFTDGPMGNSSMILPTQSEIAKHGPHDYYNWMNKTWEESFDSANQGQLALKNAYEFASRWDDPAYVGNGDTYISMANPGNSATFQMEYAQYLAGMRIEGISSNQANGVAGNDSIIGSWGLEQWAKWDPMDPIDLMDAGRQLRTDTPSMEMTTIMSILHRGGLARIYSHGPIAQPDMLQWICNNKTDPSLENWKATDGEAASYQYGRMTTDIRAIPMASNSNVQVYEVGRQDPKTAGYWLVPITVAVPIGNNSIQSVEIVGREATLSSLASSGPTLHNLSASRVMDVGYDIRGGFLYVSAFWNASSELRIHFTPSDPSILNRPQVALPVGSSYVFNATSTNGTGEVAWTLNTDAPFLSIQWSDRTHCLIAGTPTVPGRYSVSLTVSSPFHTDSVNYTLIAWQPPDLDPPSTAISGDVGHWVNQSALFYLTSIDNVSGVMATIYSIDGSPWREWTRSVLISSEGRHIVRFYSVDNAGNTEDIQQAEVLLDRHVPEARFDIREHSQFFGGRVVLHFNSWDNMSGIESVRILDEWGGSFSVRSGPGVLVIDHVEMGNRTYVLEVKDATGNAMTTAITVEALPGGNATWNDAFLVNALTLSFAAGLLCLTAVVLGRRAKG